MKTEPVKIKETLKEEFSTVIKTDQATTSGLFKLYSHW